MPSVTMLDLVAITHSPRPATAQGSGSKATKVLDPLWFSIVFVAILPRAVRSSIAQFCQSGDVQP